MTGSRAENRWWTGNGERPRRVRGKVTLPRTPRGMCEEGGGQSPDGQSTPWCGVRMGPSPL